MVDDQSLVLSSNAKPRLKWTRQLHEHFLDAVSRLGGADKATPRSVMRMMGVPGLTLFHLKSHLQKYRLAVRRDAEAACNFNGDANCRTQESQSAHIDTDRNKTKINESMLQLHMELQGKLQEQIETLQVQRHLQLRIEAQGKYLQSVLRKAQEALAGYSLDSVEMEAANAEFSEPVPAVDTDFLSSISGGGPVQPPNADCSSDSCLTSLERPDRKDDHLCKLEAGSSFCNSSRGSNEIGVDSRKPIENLMTDQSEGGKRGKRHSQAWENFSGVSVETDLNR